MSSLIERMTLCMPAVQRCAWFGLSDAGREQVLVRQVEVIPLLLRAKVLDVAVAQRNAPAAVATNLPLFIQQGLVRMRFSGFCRFP